MRRGSARICPMAVFNDGLVDPQPALDTPPPAKSPAMLMYVLKSQQPLAFRTSHGVSLIFLRNDTATLPTHSGRPYQGQPTPIRQAYQAPLSGSCAGR